MVSSEPNQADYVLDELVSEKVLVQQIIAALISAEPGNKNFIVNSFRRFGTGSHFVF